MPNGSATEQQSLLSADGQVVPAINSQFESQSLEINDTIKLKNWTNLLISSSAKTQVFLYEFETSHRWGSARNCVQALPHRTAAKLS